MKAPIELVEGMDGEVVAAGLVEEPQDSKRLGLNWLLRRDQNHWTVKLMGFDRQGLV